MLNPKLTRNARGIYEIRFTEKAPDGRSRSRVISTRSTDAELAKAFFARLLNPGQTVQPEPLVQDLCDEYEQHVLARGVTKGHLSIVRAMRAHFGRLRPADISAASVRDYNKQNEHKTDGTRRRELGVLQAVLNFARKQNRPGLGSVPTIDRPPEGRPRERFLSAPEEAEFWQALLLDSQNEPQLTRVTRFGCIALDTGARKEAIETLTWDRVRLVWDGTGIIEAMLDFRDPSRRQTKKRRPVVPVSTRLLPIIAQAYRERVDEYVCGKGSVKRCFATFVASACGGKYNWVTPHLLKHTAVSLRLQAGVTIWEVSKMVATSPVTLERVYGHLLPNHLHNAVNKRAAI